MIKAIRYIGLIGFILPTIVSAASISFGPEKISLDIGERAVVNLLLSSNEGVNALEGKIFVPAGLQVEDVSDGNSIVSLWIQRPTAQKLSSGTEVSFAGAIPGGYQANGGKIIAMKILAKKSGRFLIKPSEFQAYINDGEGTKANLSLVDLPVSVSSISSNADFKDEEDLTPPEDFTLHVSRDPALFDNQYFLVFSTQDKGSGVDYYQVNETRGFLIRPTPEIWNRLEAGGTYLLKDQELKSWVFVRAVDKSGNVRLVTRAPANLYYHWLLIITVGIIAAAGVFLVLRRNKNVFKKN